MPIDQKKGQNIEIDIQPDFIDNLPMDQDKEQVDVEIKAVIPDGYIDIKNVPDEKTIEKQYSFNGQLVLGETALEVGPENFITLENFRYTDTGIQSVHGYTKYMAASISSTSDSADTNIRSGISFKPASLFPSSKLVVNVEADSGTSSSIYTAETNYLATFSFDTAALWTTTSNVDLGRFSYAPNDNIAYANGKETCIWAGEEQPVAAFYTLNKIRIKDATDISFTNATDTIVSAAENFVNADFQPGHRIEITGAISTGNNNTSLIIQKISNNAGTNNQITINDSGALSDEAAGDPITITGDVGSGAYTFPQDFTKEVSNNLTSANNIVTIGQLTAGGGSAEDTTTLLIHCDGASGSSTFTDSSKDSNTLVTTGQFKTTTWSKKFGSTAAFCGVNAVGYLTITSTAAGSFAMSNNVFTIDFWYRPYDPIGYGMNGGIFFDQTQDANNYVKFWISNQQGHYIDPVTLSPTLEIKFKFEIKEAGVTQISIESDWIGAALWNKIEHVAVIRGWGTSDGAAITLGGAAIATGTFANNKTWPNIHAGTNFIIGNGLRAVLDEIHVDKELTRWESTFTPPTQPYQSEATGGGGNPFPVWLILTTRKIKGVKYYVEENNYTGASTLVCKGWNGSDFRAMPITDNTTSGGTTLKTTGTVTFDSEPMYSNIQSLHFEGLYLYAYLFETSTEMNVVLSKVTVDPYFQEITDIWDGVLRQPIAFQVYDGTNFKDYTLDINTPSFGEAASAIGADLSSLSTSGYILVLFEDRLAGVSLTMVSENRNTNEAIVTVSRWNGSNFVSVGEIRDTTIQEDTTEPKWLSLSQTGEISWTPPEAHEERKKTEFGVSGFAYKFSFSGGLSANVLIDTFFGIPAQKDINAFSFTAFFKNRLMLGDFKQGNERNRMDFSAPNAPNVFNGEQSSNDGLLSLYFGSNTPIIAATELYNRFGSNVFSLLVVFKQYETYILAGDSPSTYQIFPVSKNIGCIAPMTIASVEVGSLFNSTVQRNALIWMSYLGPMIFDGAIIKPIPGIEIFFKIDEEVAILSPTTLSKAIGWYDKTLNEYNLVIPISSSTTLNKWIAYDLKRKKWFEKKPEAYPQSYIGIETSLFTNYYAGGFDDGFFRLLDYGDAWDTSAITSKLKTGAFLPTGNLWDYTRLDRIMFGAETLSAPTSGVNVRHIAEGKTNVISITDAVTFASAGTMTISSGGFLTDGSEFKQGMKVFVSSNVSNSGEYYISTITDTVLTISSGSTLIGTASAATIGVVNDVEFNLSTNNSTHDFYIDTVSINKNANVHNIEIEASTTSAFTVGRITPLVWGYEAIHDRKNTK